MSEPFCFVAHKDGYWGGICSPAIGKRELNKFLGDFAREGFTITPFLTREEYVAFLGTVKEWSESPEYKAKYYGSTP